MPLPGVVTNSLPDHEKQLSPSDNENDTFKQGEITSADDSDIDFAVLDSERDIATNIISVHDDPDLNPWTLRAFVLGFGLSAFGGVLGKSVCLRFLSAAGIFEQRRFITSNQYELALALSFVYQLILIIVKQQTIDVSTLFLAIISYILGMAWDTLVPRHGLFRYINSVSFEGCSWKFII